MPTYTYRCAQGHEWDEVKPIRGSEVSEDPCATCLENADRHGVDLHAEEIVGLAGRKVPSTGVSASFRGAGWTPKFYPGRKGK